ncbi:MAG: dephospho-CoA kinase [Opitutaceae bacterium]|nr:dephospho-CoA kinase [Opitutaceae bacterium]
MGGNQRVIVGLTGNMGCGKTAAALMFAGHGFRRLDSDQLVREVLLPDQEVASAIREKFGSSCFTEEGRVRRDRVAARVFADAKALNWLENLLHPRLFVIWRQKFAEPGVSWIVEAPLLFEKRLENWFDSLVCVTADFPQQIRRLEQRGIPPDLARQRLAKQLPLEEKCELADFVLLNDGSLDFLRRQVDLVVQKLQPVR